MNSELITSRANPLVKAMRGLEQRKQREARGEFLIEGIQLVVQALQSRADVRMVVVAPELLTSEMGKAAVRDAERAGIRIARVKGEVFESIAEREHPNGLAAVVGISSQQLADLDVTGTALFVALFQVSNPGNLGTIWRTADAVGARGIILLGAATDPYAPAAVKASRGAVFTVPVARVAESGELLEWCRIKGLRILTATDKGQALYWQADLRPPCVLLFGNEGEGLPDELLRVGTQVRISMQGEIDSLNLAVAAGVLLFESVRQRTENQPI